MLLWPKAKLRFQGREFLLYNDRDKGTFPNKLFSLRGRKPRCASARRHPLSAHRLSHFTDVILTLCSFRVDQEKWRGSGSIFGFVPHKTQATKKPFHSAPKWIPKSSKQWKWGWWQLQRCHHRSSLFIVKRARASPISTTTYRCLELKLKCYLNLVRIDWSVFRVWSWTN